MKREEMEMINQVVLVGRLTKDPELRYTANGVAVATFTLAVNRTFTNQQGNREADFINCLVWRKPAENVASYLKKGSLAGVEGRLQTRSYDNNEGRRVFVTEVVANSVQFLEPRNATAGSRRNDQPTGNAPVQREGQEVIKNPSDIWDETDITKKVDINDDDLPF